MADEPVAAERDVFHHNLLILGGNCWLRVAAASWAEALAGCRRIRSFAANDSIIAKLRRFG
jgi:hypothetical protein